ERTAPSRAAGVCDARSDAVRLLHARHDHGGGWTPHRECPADRRGDREGARSKRLPVRDVSAHHGGDQGPGPWLTANVSKSTASATSSSRSRGQVSSRGTETCPRRPRGPSIVVTSSKRSAAVE